MAKLPGLLGVAVGEGEEIPSPQVQPDNPGKEGGEEGQEHDGGILGGTGAELAAITDTLPGWMRLWALEAEGADGRCGIGDASEGEGGGQLVVVAEDGALAGGGLGLDPSQEPVDHHHLGRGRGRRRRGRGRRRRATDL